MRKITLITGLLAATIGFGAVATTTSTFAMGCLNQDLPPISLSHNAMVPGAGFGYNKDAYDAAQAKGNACPTVRQGEHQRASGLESNPNEAKGPEHNQPA